MKKRFSLTLLVLIAPFVGLLAQLWQPVGGSGVSNFVQDITADSASGKIYLSGWFHHAGGLLVNETCAWNGTTFETIGLGLGAYDFTNVEGSGPDLLQITRFGSDIFVGGVLNYFDGTNNSTAYLHRYDGQVWDSCGSANATALPIACNGELFALGYLTNISGNPCSHIAKWNGTSWDAFGSYFDFRQGYTITMEYFQGSYYFGGNFTDYSPNANLKEILRWDGNAWQPLDRGILGDSWINRIIEYKGLLYVGGEFYAGSGNADDMLQAWDGNQWLPTFPDVQFSTQVRRMEIIDDQLYILAEHYVYKNGAWHGPNWLSKFDGTNFCSFGGNIAPVYDIAGLDGRFYVATNPIINGDTLNNFAEYIGGPQDEFCIIQSPPNSISQPQMTKVVVYPNPASDFAHLKTSILEAGEVSIQLFDLSGRMLQNTSFGYQTGGEATFDLDLSDLSPATYFALVNLGSDHHRVTVVKQ